jgi:hypothetical protein
MNPVRQAPTALTVEDQSRVRYLAEVLEVLYPGATVAVPHARTPGDDDVEKIVARYIVVPDARCPRLLVPAGDRRIAAAAVARYSEATSRATQRQAAVVALRTGTDRLLLRDRINVTVRPARATDSIDTYLARVLGRPVAISVHIGPARADRKPIIQVLARHGDTVGFAKLGIDPLTRDLVRAETHALNTLGRARMRNVSVPRVLHAGQWRGHEVLIKSALPIWESRTTLSTKRLAGAMNEVASSGGTHAARLAGDPYWKTLRSRLEALVSRDGRAGGREDGSNAGDEARILVHAADQLVASAGGTELTYGCWHGDWTPWNMATTASSLLVWDWERFTPGVPMGFDAVHFNFQRLIVRGAEPAGAVDTTLGRADRLLAPFEVAPEATHLTALLYLIDLAARYLEDRHAEAGAPLGVLGRWLLPVLMRKVARL